MRDSQKRDDVLDTSNPASNVRAKRAKGSVKRSLMEWRAEGGSAYREPRDRGKARPGVIAGPSAIANGAAARRPAIRRAKARARAEHVFGDRKNGMGAGIARAIGIVRARGKIKMTNLVSNMRRFVCSPFATPSNFVCKLCSRPLIANVDRKR